MDSLNVQSAVVEEEVTLKIEEETRLKVEKNKKEEIKEVHF